MSHNPGVIYLSPYNRLTREAFALVYSTIVSSISVSVVCIFCFSAHLRQIIEYPSVDILLKVILTLEQLYLCMQLANNSGKEIGYLHLCERKIELRDTHLFNFLFCIKKEKRYCKR